MNSRQKKKNQKKYVPIFADEFNLLTMTNEERSKAMTDYQTFRERFAFCKRYKDLKKKKRFYYYFPVGETLNNAIKELSNQSRKTGKLHTITQHMDDFK